MYEYQTNQVAEQVVNTTSKGTLSPKAIDDKSIHRKKNGDNKRESKTSIRKDAIPDLRDGIELFQDVPSYIDNLRGRGSPLDGSTLRFMESRFGFDFSKVRIHFDETSARSAEQLEAVAYTIGQDIVFGTGRYKPQTIAEL